MKEFLVEKCFEGWMLNKPIHEGTEATLFGETNRLYIGVDGSGETPCIFLKPKVYTGKGWEVVEYNIFRDAKKGFNRLVKMYEYNFRRIGGSYNMGEELSKEKLWA
jgi:hypothetical protein